jgi:ADP-heptose:LPS heptosyltransferase
LETRDRVLVIKHGALGDFLLSLGPMQAIRAHHPDAVLTLLTREAYRGLGEASGLFDQVLIDALPDLFDLTGLSALRAMLLTHGRERVYDLQTSSRTAWAYRLCWPSAPEWSGKVAGCSLRHVYPPDHRMHTVERQRQQLAIAGIQSVPPADLSFLRDEIAGFAVPNESALLIPGASITRPAKLWPTDRYAMLAQRLLARGVTPVVIGGPDAAEIGRTIADAAPGSLDLTGRTSLGQLAELARAARFAVGNDTGPSHLANLAGCPTLMLFGADSMPEKTGPVGPGARVLRRDDLAELGVDEVLADLDAAGLAS